MDNFDLTTLIRLIVALFLGGLIGWEREKKGRSAGLRTHILVTTGSALVMLMGVYLGDAARIAAGVITGIGFLGGGAIIQSQQDTRGMTTAASIWISAGIGLAAGCGYYSAAIFGTLVTLFTLAVLKKIEGEEKSNNH